MDTVKLTTRVIRAAVINGTTRFAYVDPTMALLLDEAANVQPATFADEEERDHLRAVLGVEPGHSPLFEAVEAPLPLVLPAPAEPEVKPAPVVRGGISETGKARAELGEVWARAGGLAPAAPIYEPGRRVNATGVANADASKRAFDDKPHVTDAMVGLERTVRAEDRKDSAPVKVSDLRMTATGLLRIPAGDVALSEAALKSLLSRTGIGGADLLLRCNPKLRATVINNWLTGQGHAEGLAFDLDHKLVVRHRRSQIEGLREGFAVVTPKYAACDTDKIAEAVRLAYGADGLRGDVVYDASRGKVKITALAHSDVLPEDYVAGEFFKAGIVITSDDTGGGSLLVRACLWRNLCLNLIIVDKASKPVARIRHLGDPAEIASELRVALHDARKVIEPFLVAWNLAAKDDVRRDLDLVGESTDPVRRMTLEQLIPGLYRGLLEREVVQIPGRREEIVAGLSRAWAAESQIAVRPESRTTLVQGLTRYAQELEPWAGADLEAQAAQLVWPVRGKLQGLPYLGA